MARKRFDPDEVLERAMELFWARGFEATSAQDLVDAMQINRGSLYDTFGSKRDLYRQALERYLTRDRDRLVAVLDDARPPQDALARLLADDADSLARDPQHRGCFLANACLDLDPDDDDLRALVSAALDERRSILAEALGAAQRRGELAERADPDALAAFLVGVMQGLRLVGKTTADRRAMQQIIDSALLTLN